MRVKSLAALLLLLSALVGGSPARGQGVMLPTVGTVNRSIGGAATAAPLDAIGALHWNPATISALPASELGFGMDLLLADLGLTSSIGGASGGTDAEPGVVPIPAIGWVHHSESNPGYTFGLGLIAAAGFKTNFPASTTNPILAPQPAGGFGRLYTEAEFLQMSPTLAVALTDQLSIGGGPMITMGKIAADPFVFAAPDDADGINGPSYPSGRGTRVHWGGGAQLGLYYIVNESVRLGASVKTPTWMETFRFHSEDELGVPKVVKTKFDLPMIVSLGASYAGVPDTLFAVDLRYFDYKNTDGFGPTGFAPDGSLNGLGWSNVMSVSAGMQRRVNERFYARLGYTYNQNPIRDAETAYNAGTPLYYQHILHVGGSFMLGSCVSMNMAYSYLLPSEVSGPAIFPATDTAIPGSAVKSETNAHILSMGVTVKY